MSKTNPESPIARNAPSGHYLSIGTSAGRPRLAPLATDTAYNVSQIVRFFPNLDSCYSYKKLENPKK